MYAGLREKQPSLLSEFNKTRNFSTGFCKTSNIKFHENLSRRCRVVLCGRTGGHDEKSIFATLRTRLQWACSFFPYFLALLCSFYGKRWRNRTRLSWLPGVPCEVTEVGNNAPSSKNGLTCRMQSMIPCHSGRRPDKRLVKTYSHDPNRLW
jgi:hypothetical protein